MSRFTSKHLYLAVTLAVAAAVSSGLYQDRFYQRLSRMLLAGSGTEAGINAGAIGEDPATAEAPPSVLAGVKPP